MSLDPQARALLDAAKASGAPEMWELTPDQARAEYLRRTERVRADVDIYRVEDRQIPGPVQPIKVRVYTPQVSQEQASLPVLVWYHTTKGPASNRARMPMLTFLLSSIKFSQILDIQISLHGWYEQVHVTCNVWCLFFVPSICLYCVVL